MHLQNAIAVVLKEMTDIAEKNEIRDATWWLDKSQLLATLWLDITEDLVRYEMAYKREIVDLIEIGDNVSKATLKVEAKSDNYKIYRYLLKKDKQIEMIIQTAKKRADLERL